MHKQILAFSIFFLIMMTISFSGHWYLYKRVFRDNGRRLGKRFLPLLLFLVVAPPLSQFLFRLHPSTSSVATIFLTWMGFALIAVLVFIAVDGATLTVKSIYRLFTRFIPSAQLALSPHRRLFLKKGFTFGAVVSAGGLTYEGVGEAFQTPRIKPVDVPLARWKGESLRIVQITDLHVGPTIRREFVEQVVEKAMSLEPDIIVLTGDIVDGSPEVLREHVEPLKKLRAPLGVFFVTGNHEYYSGVDEWINLFSSSFGFRVLRNERVRVEKDGYSFFVAGVDDWSATDRYEGHGADHEKALSGKDPSLPTILLSHQPKGFYQALPYGIDLQLSGHTHGGQIWPFGYVVSLIQPFARGLHYQNETAIYVSCGTGFWGPAIRLASPSEVTLLTLRRV